MDATTGQFETPVTRRAFLGGALAASAATFAALSGCSQGQSSDTQKEQVVFCLEDTFDSYSAGIFLAAQSEGLFSEDVELSFVTPDEGADVLETVNAGHADLGISSQEALALAFAVDEPASVAAVAAVVQHDITDRVAPATARTADFVSRDSYAVVLIANDAFLVNREDIATSTVGAFAKAYKLIASHPKKEVEPVCAQCREHGIEVDEKKLRGDLRKLAPYLLDEEGEWGSIDQSRWDGFFAWLFKTHRIDRKIPAHHGYILDYLDATLDSSGKKKSK
ncbi:MAG: ABC transporter substrate-binding protein [Coriobacteriales bacterium]|jgi:ABC-type nitrate/sulfonate/bicarbonate transport system substrate-binding protein